MTRRTLTPAGEKRIAINRRWRGFGDEMLCLENGRVCLFRTGKRPRWDHIHPLADGGGNEDDNFQPMTSEAHQKKTNGEASARGKGRRRTGANKPKRAYFWPKRELGIPGWRKKLNGKVERI